MGFLQSPDPSKKLARQYGIRGLFSPELVPSLQPVVLIDDLTGGVENNPRRIATVLASETGVAAEFTVMRFETPPRIIAHITQLIVRPETSVPVNIHWGSSVAAPATFVAGAFTDGRLRARGEVPAARLGSDTYGTGPTPLHYTLPGQSGTNLSFLRDVDWVMGRTDAFDFVEFVVSSADKDFTFGMVWEEFNADQVR